MGAILSEPTLHLKECSRWPERQDCWQDCLQQIKADPENCLVWTIVARWYEGKSCVFLPQTNRPASSPGPCPCSAGTGL